MNSSKNQHQVIFDALEKHQIFKNKTEKCTKEHPDFNDSHFLSKRTILRDFDFSSGKNEQKICFLVEKEATKTQIVEAVKTLYNEDAINVKTARTIYGKKAFVKFNSPDKARDLANKIGMM